MSRQRGFTLVELLVVIAIIALLMAILMPALQAAKRRAQSVYCRANMRSLSVAWTVYAQDNDDKIVSGEVWNNYNKVKAFDWVHPVIRKSDPKYFVGMSDHERELAGIRKGALFAYAKNEQVYNCPGDKTWKEVKGSLNATQSPYRSFAVSWAMNGQWGGIDSKYKYKSTVRIVNPSMRLVFIEEEEREGQNWGSWILEPDPGVFRWWDPIAIWHTGRSTNLGFADGHSEARFWKCRSTLEMAESRKLGWTPDDNDREDLKFIRRAYHHDFK